MVFWALLLKACMEDLEVPEALAWAIPELVVMRVMAMMVCQLLVTLDFRETCLDQEELEALEARVHD